MTDRQHKDSSAPDASLVELWADQERLNADKMEPLTQEEVDEFMKRAKARAANCPQEEDPARSPSDDSNVLAKTDPMAKPTREATDQWFFEGFPAYVRPRKLVQGLIFDFDNTLAQLNRPLDELMEVGAQQATAYMRSTGMTDLPNNFWKHLVEARLFAQKKSEDEQEEHTADDTLSFLLQFFNYPASRMLPDVLRQAVDLFYAPEMTAWEPIPGAIDLLQHLGSEGYPIAVIANYAIDRIFQRIIDYTDLRPYLDVCLSSAAVEWRKPGKEIYDTVLTRWDAEPYELVCIGDTLQHDISGGLTLGALTVHCRMIPLAEDQRIIDSVQPDEVIEDLAELPAIIQAWR